MNSLLEKYFKEYDFGEKDRYEISQIFDLLSFERKQQVLRHFPTIAKKIKYIKDGIAYEQEVLIGDAISKIRQAIETVKNKV